MWRVYVAILRGIPRSLPILRLTTKPRSSGAFLYLQKFSLASLGAER